jgi:hypothetical protein
MPAGFPRVLGLINAASGLANRAAAAAAVRRRVDFGLRAGSNACASIYGKQLYLRPFVIYLPPPAAFVVAGRLWSCPLFSLWWLVFFFSLCCCIIYRIFALIKRKRNWPGRGISWTRRGEPWELVASRQAEGPCCVVAGAARRSRVASATTVPPSGTSCPYCLRRLPPL